MKVVRVAKLGLLRLQAPQPSKSLSSEAQTNCSQASHGVLQDVCIVGWSTEWGIDHWLAHYLYRLFWACPQTWRVPSIVKSVLIGVLPSCGALDTGERRAFSVSWWNLEGWDRAESETANLETTSRPPVWLVSDYLSTLWSITLSVLTV